MLQECDNLMTNFGENRGPDLGKIAEDAPDLSEFEILPDLSEFSVIPLDLEDFKIPDLADLDLDLNFKKGE